MKKMISAAVAIAVLGTSAPALAHGRDYRDARYERAYRDGYQSARYDNRSYNRGQRSRYYGSNGCKNSNTDGTLLGAAVGAAAGNVVAPRGSKTLGTVLGGVAGGVLGNRIDSNKGSCR